MSKADSTRKEILRKAFGLTYKNGYQATSIDHILETTSVTKGAFYHHFKSKEEMGIAIIEDVIHKEIWPTIMNSLGASMDFRKNLHNMLKDLLIAHPMLSCAYGCPAVNLIQEMAPVSERFRKVLKKNQIKWRKAIEHELIRAQQTEQLSAAHDPKTIALYIITLYHGVRNLGKLWGESYYSIFLKEYSRYLQSLR